MKLAIFSDLHGKLLLPFKLVDSYQNDTGNQIDCIIQCGDAGIFPNANDLDTATIKHAKYNSDELGFYNDFVTFKPDIKEFLDELNVNMICVRGNHEDHDYLDRLEKENYSTSIFLMIFIKEFGFVRLV